MKMVVKDLGCWTDKPSERAIRPLEKLDPTLQDSYTERDDAKNKCIQATLAFGKSGTL